MKVFLVDDSALVNEKLSGLLSGIDGVEIAGHALNERDAVQSIMALKPDVVVLDIHLDGNGNGIDVLRRAKEVTPSPTVMMLTNYPYPQYREKCQDLGADYFFDKVRDIGKLYDTCKQLQTEKSAGGPSGGPVGSERAPHQAKINPIGERRIDKVSETSHTDVMPDNGRPHDRVEDRMEDPSGINRDLLEENSALRKRIMELEHLESECRRAEEAMRESEEQFRSLFDQAAMGVAKIETGTGRLVMANRRLCEMVGRTEEELIAVTFHAITHPDDRHLHEENTSLLLAGKIGAYSLEKRYIRKDGRIAWVNIAVSPLWKTGEPAGYNMIVVEDITERKKTEEQLQKTIDSLRRAIGTTIQVMVSAVESRDPYTSGHQMRAAGLARSIATEMGLPQDKIDAIRMAGSIHDIGKLSVPAEILSKPTALSEIEYSLIKEHSRKGYEMLKDVESPWPLAEIVHQHHELLDGSGYPRHLKGEEICMEARILTVADVVEAMASHRPYRAGLGIDAALSEIEKNRGPRYDSTVVDACLRLFREKGFQLEEIRY